MGEAYEKVVVNLVERDDKSVEHTGPDGQRTYYPGRHAWMDLQDLQVWRHLRETETDKPKMVLQLQGEARLQDYDISVIGEPENKTRSIRVSVQARDEVPEAFKDYESVIGVGFKPLGIAQLGFNRADWEIGNSDEWWLSCYVTESTLVALADAVDSKSLQSLKLGLMLRNLYTSEGPWAPVSSKAHLFLRPSRHDNSIALPEMASGYIVHLSRAQGRVDLRPAKVDETDDTQEHMLPREVTPDPIAGAITALSASVAALRHTIKWVGGIAAACLVILALR